MRADECVYNLVKSQKGVIMSFRKWILNIRELARADVHVANLLLDTQPIGVNVSSDETSEVWITPKDKLVQDEIDCILRNKMIDAIKLVRARTSLSLREAKFVVDKWKENNREFLNPSLFQAP